ncbi:MAG: hypothetical protein EA404_07030, partial [Spirochaetaceae bacterium]
LAGCAWNLNDSDQLGSLTINLGEGDGIGVLNLAGTFDEVTFFVVEAEHFRRSGRTVRVGPGGNPDDMRSNLLAQNLHAAVAFAGVEAVEVNPGVTNEAQNIAVPGGSAKSYVFAVNESPPQFSSVQFDNLVVGTEYVVWADALPWEGPPRLGFGTVRVRSGSDSSVSINLTDDRFPQFVDLLYSSYVEPSLQPINLAEFSSVLYAGVGSADISIIDAGSGLAEFVGAVDYDSVMVGRFEFPEENVTLFFLLFFEAGAGEQPGLVVSLIEHDGVLEPARTSYSLALFDPESPTFIPTGTIGGVDGFLEPEGAVDFHMDFDPLDPPILDQAGFAAGGPSDGGTFSLGISGSGYLEYQDFGDGPIAAEITVADLSFTFGPVLETFEGIEFEYDSPIGDPEREDDPLFSAGSLSGQSLATGFFHSAVIDESGALWGWGGNDGWYELGFDIAPAQPAAVPTGELNGAVSVAAGDSWTLFALEDGTVWGLGGNSYETLGVEDPNASLEEPQQIPNLGSVTRLESDFFQVYALTEQGNVYSWGLDFDYLLARDLGLTPNYEPGQITGNGFESAEIVAIAAGEMLGAAVDVQGGLWLWGDNRNGLLGLPLLDFTTRPEQLEVVDENQNPVYFVDVAAGRHHIVAMASDGTLYAWGRNNEGQLGLGDSTDRTEPEAIQGLGPVASVEAGLNTSFAIDGAGQAWSWGHNGNGKLGQGIFEETATVEQPEQISELPAVVEIASWYTHVLAMDSSGNIWSWGANYNNQLGRDVEDYSPVPGLVEFD